MSAARSRRANDKHNHLQRTPILVMGCSLLIACCIAFGGTNWTAKLVGVEVYSRTGNTLGTVTAFDFDPVFGAIKSITLDNGSEFKSDAFLFFAPDFVFVDDGSKSAADLRQAEDNTSDAPAAAPASTPATQPAPAAQPAAPAANADGLSNEDALLVDFLIGKTLNDDVANADDTFALPKGTEITREIALDAKKHDALLLLTMSVD